MASSGKGQKPINGSPDLRRRSFLRSAVKKIGHGRHKRFGLTAVRHMAAVWGQKVSRQEEFGVSSLFHIVQCNANHGDAIHAFPAIVKHLGLNRENFGLKTNQVVAKSIHQIWQINRYCVNTFKVSFKNLMFSFKMYFEIQCSLAAQEKGQHFPHNSFFVIESSKKKKKKKTPSSPGISASIEEPFIFGDRLIDKFL